MLARYIVIAIYGLDAFFGKDAIYLVYDIKNNCVCNYFESDSEAFLCCDECIFIWRLGVSREMFRGKTASDGMF